MAQKNKVYNRWLYICIIYISPLFSNAQILYNGLVGGGRILGPACGPTHCLPAYSPSYPPPPAPSAPAPPLPPLCPYPCPPAYGPSLPAHASPPLYDYRPYVPPQPASPPPAPLEYGVPPPDTGLYPLSGPPTVSAAVPPPEGPTPKEVGGYPSAIGPGAPGLGGYTAQVLPGSNAPPPYQDADPQFYQEHGPKGFPGAETPPLAAPPPAPPISHPPVPLISPSYSPPPCYYTAPLPLPAYPSPLPVGPPPPPPVVAPPSLGAYSPCVPAPGYGPAFSPSSYPTLVLGSRKTKKNAFETNRNVTIHESK